MRVSSHTQLSRHSDIQPQQRVSRTIKGYRVKSLPGPSRDGASVQSSRQTPAVHRVIPKRPKLKFQRDGKPSARDTEDCPERTKCTTVWLYRARSSQQVDGGQYHGDAFRYRRKTRHWTKRLKRNWKCVVCNCGCSSNSIKYCIRRIFYFYISSLHFIPVLILICFTVLTLPIDVTISRCITTGNAAHKIKACYSPFSAHASAKVKYLYQLNKVTATGSK